MIVFVLILSRAATGADWSQWRGANRDGFAVDSPTLIDQLPPAGLQPVWFSEEIPSARNGGWGSPVVANGKVYLFSHQKIELRKPPKKQFPWLSPDKRVGMSAEEYAEYEVKRRNEDEEIAQSFTFRESIFCLDAANGATLWKNQTDSQYSRFPQSGSPTIRDGKLWVLGAGLHARCLDAASGEEIWNERITGEFRDEFYQSSVALADGTAVYVTQTLTGLDAATGRKLWSGHEKLRGSHSSPVIWKHAGREWILCNVSGGSTVCLDPRDGSELWRVKTEGGLSTPVVAGDKLLTYGNSRKKGLRCFVLSTETASPLWDYHGLADKGSSPVVVGEHVYVQGERRLACVQLDSGDEAWTATINYRRPQYTSLVAADDKVFYALEGLLCFTATPDDFQPLIEARMDASGLIAPESRFRKMLGLDALEREPGGLEKSQRLYQAEIGSQGPLACASPAISDGRLFIRLRDGIACYDFRAAK